MKITDIRTFLMNASAPGKPSWRHWLFVKVYTNDGLYGVGECWGWPHVVERAIHELKPLIIGENPQNIERLWQKMFAAVMSHGMTGVVGSGAITGIEMALWDIKGKALSTPVWNLLGGKMRDRIRLYGHAFNMERAHELVERGFTGLKLFGWQNCLSRVESLRKTFGPDIDLMVDTGGGPWQTPRDAIALGRSLEPYALLFYEDPVSSLNTEAVAKVSNAVNIPIAIGESHPNIYALAPLIEREIIDVAQPDTGRFGGLSQMRKLSVIAETHFVMIAPHNGSLGPVAEIAAVHLMATIPNFLIQEHLVDDVPQRYNVMSGQPNIVDGHIIVPNSPGLGIDIDEKVVIQNPPNSQQSLPSVESASEYDFQYVGAHYKRARWLEGCTEGWG